MRAAWPVVCLATALLLACAGRHGPSVPSLPESPASRSDYAVLQAEDYSTQRLFRARFQTQKRVLSFRMVLRLVDGKRYQLTASDPLGRRVWALDYAEPETHFVDYRAELECRTQSPTGVVELALDTIAVKDVPAILLGRLPADLARIGDSEVGEFRDGAGRRWSTVMSSDSLSWSLWQGNARVLWFQGSEDGGVLSHRRGEQFRWRQVRSEILADQLQPVDVPEGVASLNCEELEARRRGS